MPNDPPKPPLPPEIPEVHVHIKLTSEQQEIVYERTGRKLESFYLDDAEGILTSSMHMQSPDAFILPAVHAAEILNEYDEDYHEYLKELAEWQDEQKNPDPMDELARKAEVAAEIEAERIKLFHEKEAQAVEAAKEMAKSQWKTKE